jgi:hypothetical protein
MELTCKEILKQEAELEKIKKSKKFEEWLFHKLFFFDIFRKVRVAEITNKNHWDNKEPPKPLKLQNAKKMTKSQVRRYTC